MRIALCLYGETRDYYNALPSWEKFITKYQPDLFWHTWDSLPIYGIFSYNLKAGHVEVSKKFDTYGVTEWGSSARNVLSQVYSIDRSIQLMSEYSEERPYDFVVRARFDLVLLNPEAITFEYLDPSKFYICDNHWRGSNDIFDDNLMIGNQSNMIEHNGYLRINAYHYIHTHKLIPSGEQLISDRFKSFDLMENLVRTDMLNFTLARNL